MFTQNQLEALIEQFISYDDSEHFPIREHVRDSIAQGLTIEDTALWLEEETIKRFPESLRDLPWVQIALHFHQDVTELVAYEQAHGLPPSPVDEDEGTLSPAQVPLPLNDLWRRKLYAHYVKLFQQLDRLICQIDPRLEQDGAFARENVLMWRKFLRDQHDDPVVAEHEQHLSLLSRAMAQDVQAVQSALAQFPATSHLAFNEAYHFVCRRCSFQTTSVRVAYYHGYFEMEEEFWWDSGYVQERHEDTVTIWIDGIEHAITVPLTKAMPEWMLEGQYFTTTYPRQFRSERKIPPDFVNWGPFELLPGMDMTEEELLSGITECFSAECIVNYRCGHQEQVTIFPDGEPISQRIAEYACGLCHSCQTEREQQQFEEVIQQANQAYNITDQK